MRIEHVAFNVAEPVAVAAWYCEHFGMQILRALDDPAKTHFLVDSGGEMQLEIYNNPPDQVPDYPAMHPLQLHLAFVAAQPQEDKTRLEQAGATLVEDLHLPDGSNLVMMKDPWGHSIQLCRRGP